MVDRSSLYAILPKPLKIHVIMEFLFTIFKEYKPSFFIKKKHVMEKLLFSNDGQNLARSTENELDLANSDLFR